MKQKLKVMIAGAGGNNSWLVAEISRLIKNNQIPDEHIFKIYDGDSVEKKNMLYQNFNSDDELENKAKVLGDRYSMIYSPKYITDKKTFDGFDVVISGVDNREFREMLFKYMSKNPDKYWIDLRAEGRVVGVYTKHKINTLSVLLEGLPPKGSKGTSCQLSYELDSGIIQLGNKIVAVVGAQCYLNYIRGDSNPPKFVHMF